MERTSEEKILGGLTHLAIFFSWLGLIINVILYVVYRPKSQFVAGHVKQAIGLQVIIMVAGAALGLLFGAGVVGGIGMGSGFGLSAAAGSALLGGLLWSVVLIGLFVLSIMGAVRGFQGQEYRHPIIGDWVAGLGES